VHVISPERDKAALRPGHSESHTIKKKMSVFLDEHPITGVPFEAWVARGPIAETLIDLVRCEQIDLIALGTRGLGQRLPALGSVAGRILSEAPCPVLTVGEQMRAHKAARIGRILYATDFSPASLRALPYALSLAKKKDSHLMLLYVDTREVTFDYLVEAAFEGKLLNLLPADAHLCGVEPIIGIGPVANGVIDTALEHDADVIVMGSPLEAPDCSIQIHLQAHCPVLSVR
jgi:nucleotide-binding universal stress UspA family protein